MEQSCAEKEQMMLSAPGFHQASILEVGNLSKKLRLKDNCIQILELAQDMNPDPGGGHGHHEVT